MVKTTVLKFESSKDDLSDSENGWHGCWCQMVLTMRIYPVISSSLGGDTLLMPEVIGQWVSVSSAVSKYLDAFINGKI